MSARVFHTCTIEGCERAHYGRGYCDSHWKRWRLLGDPIAPRIKRTSKYPPLNDSGWLRHEYVIEGRSLDDLSAEVGCSLKAVTQALRRHEIPVRPPGYVKHGYSRTPTYASWQDMLKRCRDLNHRQWKHYGGRGITVCERWKEAFVNFLSDMGEKPDGLSLDRIDNDGNYEPGNCRWATYSEQNYNRRASRLP